MHADTDDTMSPGGEASPGHAGRSGRRSRPARAGRSNGTPARRLRERAALLAGAGLVASGLVLAVLGSQAGAAGGPIITTHPSASTVTLGQSVTDAATLTVPGFASGLPPVPLQFYTCGPFPSAPALGECTTSGPGTSVGLAALGAPVLMQDNSGGTALLATSPSFTPVQAGVYCFGSALAFQPELRSHNDNPATPAAADECFTVEGVAVPRSVASDSMTASPSSPSITLGASDTDVAHVTGTGAGAPTGTVAFTVCGPTAGAVACTGDASDAQDLGSSTVRSGQGGAGTGSVRTAHAAPSASVTVSSAPFTPSAAGTYCFFAAYGGDAFYAPASASSPSTQCFVVAKAALATKPGSPIDPGFTTTLLTPSTVAVGSTARDSAVLTGTSGAPTGTVTFTACRETATGTPCTGGATLATLTAPTTSGAGRSVYDLPATDGLRPSSPGTWCFSASYGGDGTYAAMAAESDPAAECFAVTAAATPVTAAASGGAGTAIAGATTAHTGAWWAGGAPYVLVATGAGVLLLALGVAVVWTRAA